jgi:integrase
LVERYVKENQTWRRKTKHENEAIYDMFIRVVEDQPLTNITRMMVSEYKRILLKLPPCLNLHKRYSDMPVSKILKDHHTRTVSPTTVNKHLVRLSTIFKYAVHNGLMENNPATEMQIKTRKRDDELRAAYTKDDLDKLFKSDAYQNDTHRHSYQFWIPILGLYTGARLEELCQLHLEDIRQEEGVWVIDINDNEEKRIKTKSSKRLIPLHPFLVEDLGLVRHAQELRKQGRKRLFPELTRRRDGYGQTVSKWFNERYKVKCGITPPPNGAKLDFHSFRHTFVNELKQQQVNPDLIRELDGHKKGDMTMDRYGKAFGPRLLLDAVLLLSYGYPHLSGSRWVRG